MTGRGTSFDDEQQDHGRGSGQLLLVAAMALALVAAAVLVLSDNARWLRLAVVAALWAALVGAFLAARYRRQVADREEEVADLQSVYELELEREVAARHEYELEVETEVRKRVKEESREDLEALRGELRALRENLEALLGGEVLVERVALRAESTRMRSLSDQSRLMAVGDKRVITATGGSNPAVSPVVGKAPPEKPSERTELIERVAHEPKTQPRREPARPEPARPEPPRTSPQQRPQPPVVARRESPEPQRSVARGTDSVAARLGPVSPARPSQERTEFVTRQARVEPPKVQPSKTQPPKTQPPKTQPPKTQSPKSESPKSEPPKTQPPKTQPPKSEPPRRTRATERTEMISPETLSPPEPRMQSGGGRRRAEDRQPERAAWDTLDGWNPAKEEADKPAGAHADGKSVNELLASLGGTDMPRRRRRRED